MPIIIFLIDLFGMVKPCESLYNVVDIENQYLRLKNWINKYLSIFYMYFDFHQNCSVVLSP